MRAPVRPGFRRRRTVVLVAGALVLVAAAGIAYRVSQAFVARAVLPGEIYRSRQPDADDLGEVSRRLGIKSVVNLRGPSPEADWYREEVDAAARLGLEHGDFFFRNLIEDWPQQYETRALVRHLDRAERPVLLHCLAGVDRTGWASAIALALEGRPIEQAREQLARIRGHLCGASCRLRAFFDQYEATLAERGLEHDAGTFRSWVFDDYSPGPYDAVVEAAGDPLPASLPAGETVKLRIRVRNLSREGWRLTRAPEPGMRLGVRALGPFDEFPERPVDLFREPWAPAVDLARAGPASGSVEPGRARVIRVGFDLPREPGRYLLQVDMVDENVHWFSDLGGPGLILPIEVTDRKDAISRR